MKRSMPFVCHDPDGFPQARVADYTLAGVMMGILGPRSTVRVSGRVVFTEGVDGDCAESFDSVWQHCMQVAP